LPNPPCKPTCPHFNSSSDHICTIWVFPIHSDKHPPGTRMNKKTAYWSYEEESISTIFRK
jgi:hypothetical protein